jgi:hypothetical protein
MAANKVEVEAYFLQVVVEYNCGDVRELLRQNLDQAGPLLACTVNGIDTVGGMMLGFSEGSRKRSTAFMCRHLNLLPEEADLIYALVRCGLSHEGISKLAVQFFVCEEQVHPGVFLYKDHQNSIWLNVTELAHSYLRAIERIGADIHAHCTYIPTPSSKEIEIYRDALSLIKKNIADFYFSMVRNRGPMASSLSPFLPAYLNHFTVGKTT